MKRPAAKRKSEGAGPSGKSKQRKASPPAQRKGKERGDACDSGLESDSTGMIMSPDNNAPVVCQNKEGKSRKSEPARVDVADEYEEDEGRAESHQFLALVHYESKKKKLAAKVLAPYFDKFNQQLKDDDEHLKQKLKELSEESTNLDRTFADDFGEAFVSSRPSDPPSGDFTASQAATQHFSTRYEESQKSMREAKMMLSRFEEDAKLSTTVEAPMQNSWGEEGSKRENILKIGQVVGLERYKSLMVQNKVEEFPVEKESAPAVEVIYEGLGQAYIGWGRIARRQDKGMRKISKAFDLGAASRVGRLFDP